MWSTIRSAIIQFERRVCLNFIHRTNEKYFLDFSDDGKGGCWSYVGRRMSGQPNLVCILNNTLKWSATKYGTSKYSRSFLPKILELHTQVVMIWKDFNFFFSFYFSSKTRPRTHTRKSLYSYFNLSTNLLRHFFCTRVTTPTTHASFVVIAYKSPIHRLIPANHIPTTQINLSVGCNDVGIVLQEMMHALGYFHEHQRPDRDEHVRVIWENVQPGDVIIIWYSDSDKDYTLYIYLKWMTEVQKFSIQLHSIMFSADIRQG